MRASADTVSSAGNLLSAWARGRRQLTPWAYPWLRALAILRFTIGLFLTGLGAWMVSDGHPEWAALPLGGAALHFAIAYLDVTAARAALRRA